MFSVGFRPVVAVKDGFLARMEIGKGTRTGLAARRRLFAPVSQEAVKKEANVGGAVKIGVHLAVREKERVAV